MKPGDLYQVKKEYKFGVGSMDVILIDNYDDEVPIALPVNYDSAMMFLHSILLRPGTFDSEIRECIFLLPGGEIGKIYANALLNYFFKMDMHT